MITRLSDIIDTGSQAELLAFFLTATPRSFTVPELSHRLKLNSSAIQTAVNSLEKQNILKTFSKNYTRFYILNSKHAMVPDLLASFKKEHKQWPDELTSNLKKLGNLSGIFLSGVFVGRPELVVDLLLVGNVNSARLSQFLKTAQKQFGGELNYSIMSPAEFRIRRDTFDRFIKDVFDYPHIVLVDKSDSSAKPRTTSKKRVVKSINTPKAKPQPKVATKPQAKKSIKKVVTVAKKKVAKVAKKKTAKPAKKVTRKPVRKPVPKKVVKKPSRKSAPKKTAKNIRKPVPKKFVKNTSKKTKKKKR